MKKLLVMCLGIFLVVSIIGCGGGGGGGPKSGTIYFSIPSYYAGIEEKDNMYAIPSGKPVNFYTVAENGDTINADNVFTGTTGQGVIKVTLPSSLKNQQRYIYASVSLNSSFDLRGKTQEKLLKAIMSGNLLFGKVVDSEGETAKVTLADGATIGNFEFMGKDSGEAINIINFRIPEDYIKSDDSSASIPKNKEIQFYVLTKENYESFDDGETKVEVLHTFKGITGRDLSFKLPSTLKSEDERAIVAIVVLEGAFNLQGMNKNEFSNYLLNGHVLFGSPKDSDGQTEFYALDGNTTVENFEMRGK